MSNKDTDYSIYLDESSYTDFPKDAAVSHAKKASTGKKVTAKSKKKRTSKTKKTENTVIEKFKEFWNDEDNKTKKIIIIVALVVLIILMVIGGYAWSKLSLIDTNGEDDFVADDYESDIDFSQMNSITDANSLNDLLIKWANNGGEKMSSKHVKNVLLIGKDSLSSLADTMMLVSVNQKTEQITLISFYRDSYTYVQPKGKKGTFGKLNSSYSRGGAQCVIETIENNYKIEIDEYVMVDYSSFPKIIDALGGVDVNVTEKEANYLNKTWRNWTQTGNPVSYKAGVNRLNGEKALMFCRIRGLDSDIGRTERQRRVISSLITSFKSAGVSKINAAVNEVFPNIKTSMSRTEILSFAANAVSGGWLSYPMAQSTMPPDGLATGGYIGDQWVWIVDYEASAYQLQMLLYGKSNIEMSEDRVSPITLKPTKVTSVSSTSEPVESTTIPESTTKVEETTVPPENTTEETTEPETTETTDPIELPPDPGIDEESDS